MARAATPTIQSIPPAACITDAAVMTTRTMNTASVGGLPGLSWKPNTRTKSPTRPQTPSPMPAWRTPRKMASTTTSPSRMISKASIGVP